jgi:RNA polymerase sigma factor (sigma-70 family)
MTTPPYSAAQVPVPRHTAAFEAWFCDNYPKLTADLMAVGADYHLAQECAQEAAADLLRRWRHVKHPYAYARRAAINVLIKTRERGPRRLQDRLVQRAEVTSAREDPGLTAWEDREWVAGLLSSLPTAQRQVIACVIDDFEPKEIAELLGKTPEAVRRALADARKALKHDLAAEAEAVAVAKAGSRSIPAALVGSKENR